MKMTRPAVTSPNLDCPEVRAYLEGATPVSTQAPTQATEKTSEQKPVSMSPHIRTQMSEQKSKMQKSPAPKSAVKSKPNKKELIIPDSVVIDEKASGKFLVEMPKVLRQNIKQKSLDTGKSMNELILSVLNQAFG